MGSPDAFFTTDTHSSFFRDHFSVQICASIYAICG